MQRQILYGLCQRWGQWASSLDTLGITGIALFINANTGQSGGIPSADLMYKFPSIEVKEIHEAVETLSDEEKAIMLAHFKRDLSYAKIGKILGKSKPWVQKKVNDILKKIEERLEKPSIRVYA